MSEKRVNWIDAAKFLGIVAIYIGHFGPAAGKSYAYVFQYHVALFFFLSGCTNCYDKEENFLKYVYKRFKSIMIPYWFFCLLSIILYAVQVNVDAARIGEVFVQAAEGAIRNQFIAGSLWFLPCLFLMEVVFKLLKYLKNRWIILVLCLGIYYFAENIMNPHPVAQPSWWYNADSVVYYIVYFAIGYAVYPYLAKLFTLDIVWKKIVFAVSGILTCLNTLHCLDGNNYVLNFLNSHAGLSAFGVMINALLMIWFHLILAKLLENSSVASAIGKETLYLCGNEFIIKNLFTTVAGLLGLTVVYPNPLYVYVYVFILLGINVKWLIPAEKKMVKHLCWDRL